MRHQQFLFRQEPADFLSDTDCLRCKLLEDHGNGNHPGSLPGNGIYGMAEKEKGINEEKTVKLVSAVVVLGVLCAAYEGVNFYVTSQEEKETEENDTSVDLVSLEADDITAVSFTADQNEVEFDKKMIAGQKNLMRIFR